MGYTCRRDRPTAAPAEFPVAAPAGSARLDSLTGLRFFAAAAIVVYHSWWPFTGSTELGLFHYSYTAVGFFFTLSGVVLAWSWKPGTGVRVQWRRRAARILPLHWLTLAATVAIYLIWPLTRPVTDTRSALLTSATLLQAWPPFEHLLTFNFPSWSLSTEAFFYLTFPLLMVGLRRLSVTPLLWSAAGLAVGYVAAALALHVAAVPTLTDGSMLALPPLQLLKFAAGACLGSALRLGWRPRLPLWAALSIFAVAVLSLPYLTSSGITMATTLRTGPLFPDLVLLGPMVLVVVAAAGGDLRAWRRHGGPSPLGRLRMLTRLGEWSFAMYLVHAPLLFLYYAWRLADPGRGVLGLGGLGVYLVACVAVAGVLHTRFERPVERWIRRRETGGASAATPLRVAVPPQRVATAEQPQVPVGAS